MKKIHQKSGLRIQPPSAEEEISELKQQLRQSREYAVSLARELRQVKRYQINTEQELETICLSHDAEIERLNNKQSLLEDEIVQLNQENEVLKNEREGWKSTWLKGAIDTLPQRPRTSLSPNKVVSYGYPRSPGSATFCSLQAKQVYLSQGNHRRTDIPVINHAGAMPSLSNVGQPPVNNMYQRTLAQLTRKDGPVEGFKGY